MAKPNVNFRIEETLLKVLDDICKILGVTRSEFVRNAVIYYISYLKSASFITDIKNAYIKKPKQIIIK